MPRGPQRSPSPAAGAAIGMVAGMAGTLAMDAFAGVMAHATGGHEAEGAAPGAEREGRGVQPPQANGRAEEDATVRAGSLVFETVTGSPPAPREKLWLGTAAHYAFGAGAGLLYGLAATRTPRIRAGFGTMYGSLVWLVADQGLIPALGLSRTPRQLSPGLLAYALAGHWAFGAGLEAAFRAMAGRR